MRWDYLTKIASFFFAIFILPLIFMAASRYSGSLGIYLLFTALSNLVLFSGFCRHAIFFDAFIGVLLWLGFWLKFSVRTAFFDGEFVISVGMFDGTPSSCDRALLVTSCALLAILVARLIRQYFFRYPSATNSIGYRGIFKLYKQHKTLLIIAFIVFILGVTISNLMYGFYQRGQIAKTILPLGLNGVYTWLLMFGLASFSSLILRFEFELNRDKFWPAIFLSIAETAMSSISLLSRGMILNCSSLLYGTASLFKGKETFIRLKLISLSLLVFLFLFFISVVTVNIARANLFYGSDNKISFSERIKGQSSILLLDRWVGIEGVMSVVGNNNVGWPLFHNAIKESFDYSKNSFYDANFIKTSYNNSANDNRHFVSLPGYIAFLFYPGSYLFLFFAVFSFSILAASFEWLVYRLGGENIVFCSLIAQVIAFRYTSFGYVPLQSYMLFGSIILNVLILFFADKIIYFYYKHRALSL